MIHKGCSISPFYMQSQKTTMQIYMVVLLYQLSVNPQPGICDPLLIRTVF